MHIMWKHTVIMRQTYCTGCTALRKQLAATAGFTGSYCLNHPWLTHYGDFVLTPKESTAFQCTCFHIQTYCTNKHKFSWAERSQPSREAYCTHMSISFCRVYEFCCRKQIPIQRHSGTLDEPLEVYQFIPNAFQSALEYKPLWFLCLSVNTPYMT